MYQWIPDRKCMLRNLRIQWRSGAGVVLQTFMSQEAVRFCHKERLLREYSFIVEQSHKPPSRRSKRVKCSSQRPLREAKPTGPKVSYSGSLQAIENWEWCIE
mmetsp:Transcript_3715/g.7603  ORF Transcript_3715/g.7603 Transcript_3715/m.7603 type:complete len:102 (-) Transcript_3715:357-662(-)